MKRMLLVVAVAVLVLSTLAIPTDAHADGGAGGTSCQSGQLCKP